LFFFFSYFRHVFLSVADSIFLLLPDHYISHAVDNDSESSTSSQQIEQQLTALRLSADQSQATKRKGFGIFFTKSETKKEPPANLGPSTSAPDLPQLVSSTRPVQLPPKNPAEERRHMQMHLTMVKQNEERERKRNEIETKKKEKREQVSSPAPPPTP